MGIFSFFYAFCICSMFYKRMTHIIKCSKYVCALPYRVYILSFYRIFVQDILFYISVKMPSKRISGHPAFCYQPNSKTLYRLTMPTTIMAWGNVPLTLYRHSPFNTILCVFRKSSSIQRRSQNLTLKWTFQDTFFIILVVKLHSRCGYWLIKS